MITTIRLKNLTSDVSDESARVGFVVVVSISLVVLSISEVLVVVVVGALVVDEVFVVVATKSVGSNELLTVLVFVVVDG